MNIFFYLLKSWASDEIINSSFTFHAKSRQKISGPRTEIKRSSQTLVIPEDYDTTVIDIELVYVQRGVR